jgi:hypothetical protein
MTNKKKIIKELTPKKPVKKVNPTKSFALIFIISVIFVLLLPYFKNTEVYTDNTIGLNKLEKNFSEGKYNKVLIDENKAFATYNGT